MREQLLRQALESGKTTSKKQKTKQASLASSGVISKNSSRAGSAANSRAGSTATSPQSGSVPGSHAGSDDEGDSLTGFDSGDVTDDLAAKFETQLGTDDSWENALAERIANILSRGKRRDEDRLEDLRWYLGILQNHYAPEEIQSQLPQIVRQLLRASTAEDEKEATLALKALGVTALTDQSEDHFETCSGPLKSLVQDYGDQYVKADAIRALAIVTYISGSQVDIVPVLTFLLEIIESDGSRVLADDSATVVAAATTAFSFCCSRLPSLEPQADYLQDVDREFSQEAIEGIAEQVESSAVNVQIAAAEAIALLFEKSFRKATFEDSAALKEDVHTGELPDVIQKYSPYRGTNQLLEQLQSYFKSSTKSTAKKDRHALNDTLRDVIQSLEHPGWGPGWRVHKSWKAEGRDNRNKMQKADRGPSITVKTDAKGGSFLVTKWWQQIRARELRSLLGHGFTEHFRDNPVIEESLFQEFDDSGDESDDEDDVESDVPANGAVNGKSVSKIEVSKTEKQAKGGKRGMDKWRSKKV